jgi:hypothetical protein
MKNGKASVYMQNQRHSSSSTNLSGAVLHASCGLVIIVGCHYYTLMSRASGTSGQIVTHSPFSLFTFRRRKTHTAQAERKVSSTMSRRAELRLIEANACKVFSPSDLSRSRSIVAMISPKVSMPVGALYQRMELSRENVRDRAPTVTPEHGEEMRCLLWAALTGQHSPYLLIGSEGRRSMATFSGWPSTLERLEAIDGYS